MKKLFLLFASVSILAACGNEETETGSVKDTYVVGIDETFAPMSFRNNEGDIVGFDVDLAEEVGEMMGVTFTFQPIDWVMKETELNAGNIDLIWNGYSITEERKEKVAFTDPYLDNKQIIVTLADSDIETKADLAGKVVATQQGSATLDALNADETGVVEEFDGGEPILYPTFTDVFNDLDSGRSEAIVVDEVLGRYIMKQKGQENYKVLEENFGEEEYGVGVRKDDTELLDNLNESLDELKKNGTYDEIYQTWFAE
ncbi:amino acid ABC transporter substrate-binding protein [Jeotgalibaca caeni]|uniref:amino acid ABC transporter substrate-binding protein n=1 Tax=Jeotgalibaca caeni TaxID=3028623 RepID=UPI00237ED469|nr:amino acid ABC transporter substrate-binding protein [Jeotgalibaca caeni]MDE1548380.1 amino acid ABC transporter substrate-binding protein [Jeotgalibaca caeni]